jgi:hypothetical protein
MTTIDFAGARRRPSAALSSPLLVLPLLIAAAASGLGALSLLAPVPNTTDEAFYIELARNLARSGRFVVLDIQFPVLTYAPAYVALVAPFYWLTGSAQDAYVAIRELNAVVFASAAVPAFLIAARVVSRRSALLVAAATIALPAGVYATKVMTETLAFTVVLWCVVAALRVVERPTPQRQLILLICVSVAATTRFELLVLGPALAMACVVARQRGVRKPVRELALLLLGTIMLTLGALWLLHMTSGAAAGAGAHGFAVSGFSVLRFAKVALGSLGAFDLYTGVLPFGCLLLALFGVRRGAQWVSPALRTLVVLAVTCGVALLLVASAYLASVPAAFRPPIPSERYTFYVAPLVVVVFAAWLEAGGVRARDSRGAAAVAGAAPFLAAALYVHHIPTFTFSGLAFEPWFVLDVIEPLLAVCGLLLYCGLCAHLLASTGAKSAHARVKPVLAVTSITLFCGAILFVLAPTFSPPPGWLDAHTSGRVIAVWGVTPPATRSQALGEMMAANDRLEAVYFLKRPDTRGFAEVERRVTEQPDGRLLINRRRLAADFVLTDAKTRFVGTLVAKSNGFAIYKVDSPLRVARSPR